MPYTQRKRKIIKRVFKKKKTYRRRSKYPPILSYNNNIGLPTKKMVKLCYHDAVTLLPGVGLLAKYDFMINNIFDPNYTGTGHQPMGHDEWAQLYTKYMVRACKVSIKYSNETSGNVPIRVGATFDEGGGVQNTVSALIERNHGKCTKLLLGNSRDSQVVNCYWSAKKFWALKNPSDNHSISGSFGAAPSHPAYCTVWAGAADGVSGSTHPVLAEVKLEMYVELSEPKDISQS